MLLQKLLSELHDLVPAECFIPNKGGLHSCWSDTEGICADLPYDRCSPRVLQSFPPQGEKTSLCGAV